MKEMKKIQITAGYYRCPTIDGDSIVFVCEEDLWIVSAEGGIPRRLTTSFTEVLWPRFSPDGELLAFVGRGEGPMEVYVMPALGGEAKRLTYQDHWPYVAGWTPDGSEIIYASGAGQPAFAFSWPWLWKISPDGGAPTKLPYGPATHISYAPSGRVVLGRNTSEPAAWKRYRGGTVGHLWVDVKGDGDFQRLFPANGNYTCPMWIGDRIYFISDHEGIGNLYSCSPSGKDLQRHTHYDNYYIRNASTDGKRIVYHAGGDLYVFEVASDTSQKVEIDYRSPLIQHQRKFVETREHIQEWTLHPKGHALCITVRGKPFTMANWEGAVLQHGEQQGVRYRLTQWLNDGKRLVTVSDAGGEEALEIHWRDGSEAPIRLEELNIGRPYLLEVSPKKDQIILSNHRFELLFVDLETQKLRILDKSEHRSIQGLAWSPDGRWVAYGFCPTIRTSLIKICRLETGEIWNVTSGEFNDVNPAWDPEGKYLYFLSYRMFQPVREQIGHSEYAFPQAMRPFLITLKPDLRNPFVPQPPLEADEETEKEEGDEKKDEDKKKKEKEKPIDIDFEGIQERVVEFPVEVGRYGQIAGIKGKVLFTSFPLSEGAKGTLLIYDFKEQKKDTLFTDIDQFILSRDYKTLAYVKKEDNRSRVRVLKAGEKPDEKLDEKAEGANRRSGWIDLERIQCSVDPMAEWEQIYREAWRMQREYFWTEDMSGVDWKSVHERYLPLLSRITTRRELSDLIMEMQAELGTSHTYVYGGDLHNSSPWYGQGFLGADFAYDEKTGGYQITHIVRGDAWDSASDSPLNDPGLNLKEGDVLLAVGGQKVSANRSPSELLVNFREKWVELTIQDQRRKERRSITAKALSQWEERNARYREWVVKNRKYVHEKTDDRVGYVHIPDMVLRGYAEFHRGYLAELEHPALIVDVRYNGGGYLNALILEKLARRRIGYGIRRWESPLEFPYDAVMGPIVALTNEYCGSDGDLFCHSFKLMQLGKLIGKRTWGGVIGTSNYGRFVDQGGASQPTRFYWFTDVGWGIENHGVEPDIEVEYRPQDYMAGIDPQLDRAIEEILKQLEENPPKMPDFGNRPRLKLPSLIR
jgi:tricorn protease